jgi:Histone chaperone Rttp106-like
MEAPEVAFVSLHRRKGTFLVPDGNYAIELHKKNLRLVSPSSNLTINYDNILDAFMLPLSSEKADVFVIRLKRPLRNGRRSHDQLHLKLTWGKHKMTVHMEKGKRTAPVEESLRGPLNYLFRSVFMGFADMIVFTPHDDFANAVEPQYVDCTVEGDEGKLFPLRSQFVFLHDQAVVVVDYSQIESVDVQPDTSSSGSARRFHLNVKLRSDTDTASPDGSVNDICVSGIDGGEYIWFRRLLDVLAEMGIFVNDHDQNAEKPRTEDLAGYHDEDSVLDDADDLIHFYLNEWDDPYPERDIKFKRGNMFLDGEAVAYNILYDAVTGLATKVSLDDFCVSDDDDSGNDGVRMFTVSDGHQMPAPNRSGTTTKVHQRKGGSAAKPTAKSSRGNRRMVGLAAEASGTMTKVQQRDGPATHRSVETPRGNQRTSAVNGPPNKRAKTSDDDEYGNVSVRTFSVSDACPKPVAKRAGTMTKGQQRDGPPAMPAGKLNQRTVGLAAKASGTMTKVQQRKGASAAMPAGKTTMAHQLPSAGNDDPEGGSPKMKEKTSQTNADDPATMGQVDSVTRMVASNHRATRFDVANMVTWKAKTCITLDSAAVLSNQKKDFLKIAHKIAIQNGRDFFVIGDFFYKFYTKLEEAMMLVCTVPGVASLHLKLF